MIAMRHDHPPAPIRTLAPMKVISVVGARPQFVKAAAVSRAFAATDIDEQLVHTGQHYDEAMSGAFFDELDIPPPRHHLDVGSGPHGQQTGTMMTLVEQVVLSERPDCVLVYGDTNSTLAGALVASKLHVPVAHVEAGLRSFDRTMPEEINRVVTDHVSDHLYCPSPVAVANLANEGVERGVYVVGDVMFDVLQRELASLGTANPVAEREGVGGDYVVVTIHRPGNTDDPARLEQIQEALDRIGASGTEVVWPVHPRTTKLVRPPCSGAVRMVPPASYRETLALLRGARAVVTDSGGLQKEAYWMATPCITVRPSTEWTETVDTGWNVLVDADADRIEALVASAAPGAGALDAYGDGSTATRIVGLVEQLIAGRG